MRFHDRHDAGKILARLLQSYANDPLAIVLALPRGGVPVAHEIARELHLPLDVFVVRKLGAPDQEELAIGAVASGGTRILNDRIVRLLGLSVFEIDLIAARELKELERRELTYRGPHALDIAAKTVIIVDDGLATGASMRVAVRALRALRAAKIIVAVPVGAQDSVASLTSEADEVVCLTTPNDFAAVGEWYDDFSQTTDAEVTELLREQRAA